MLEEIKSSLDMESPHFRTSLVSVGHIAYLCPDMFTQVLKGIVSKTVVKELLMQDREHRKDSREWCVIEMVSEETMAKMEGMKLMVRWLLGMKTSVNSGTSTLRLLTTVIKHEGDLMERGAISVPEKAWLRLTAGCCMLKLAQDSQYADLITPEQFQTIGALLTDSSTNVKERFAQKLHKGLISLKLPLEYMAVFALGGREPSRELRNLVKQYLQANVNKRREYIKSHTLSSDKMLQYLPDYVLPYVIHLLAHDKDFKKFDHVKSLQLMKDSLWFIMEHLILRNENYSFSFFKRLIDNMKQTKDAQSPDDELQNMKLYAVCDLALGLVLSKTNNFVLKEFPVEPTLPGKLYTDIDKNYNNHKTYLPAEMAVTPPKKSGIELEMLYSPGDEEQGNDEPETKRPRNEPTESSR
jgi:sister-chromatid-cohesion protein PDS5